MAAPAEFKPVIVGFLCNWCCYGGADLCGVSRFQYPPYLRVIRLMCSGRVDLEFIFRAFAKKADGVFIGGCHLNDCHYNPEGNYDALGNSLVARRILEHVGVNPERLRLEWVSAGEGIRFAEIMNEISVKIKSLGPLGSSEGKTIAELQAGLQAATDLVPYIKLVERERFRVQERTEENYHKLFASAEFDRLFQGLVLDKLAMGRIMGYARARPTAANEIATGLHLPDQDVARHLNVLAERGMVRLEGNQVQVVAAA
ncbi:MAG: methyl-viologen-reducing hydrogenase subunit delta [Betaproteobacteria bacterium RIFCSPLOWO2_12_FULL_65_14]|nr:MAG: methyl-viologen-reducing hydrogenase subunit delta [Betaproteobacteria bacterium RIFCSPLOWO2_12_FULL_65_14]